MRNSRFVRLISDIRNVNQIAASGREVACELEALGYGTLWFGESPLNKEAFAHAGLLLAATERVVVATGIASIWLCSAAAANGAAALAEASLSGAALGGRRTGGRSAAAKPYPVPVMNG